MLFHEEHVTGGALEGCLLLDLSSCFLGSRSSIAQSIFLLSWTFFAQSVLKLNWLGSRSSIARGLMPRRHHGSEKQPLLKEKAYKVLLKAQGAAINE